MAKAQGHGLAHKDAVDVLGQDVLHHMQQLVLAFGFQLSFKLGRDIKVIFYGTLETSRDKDKVLHTCGDGQHLFGACFGGRQESCAKTCHGEDCFFYCFHYGNFIRSTIFSPYIRC